MQLRKTVPLGLRPLQPRALGVRLGLTALHPEGPSVGLGRRLLQRTGRGVCLGLTLLAAALGVLAGTASGQASSSAPKKTTSAKASGSSHGKKSTKKSRRRERGQKAPTPDRISEIQEALAKDGSFTGKPNGKWDASTVDAMKRFQETHGLNATGKLDAKTLQQLGLGSSTAGVAAPQPAANSTKLTNPATQSARRQ